MAGNSNGKRQLGNRNIDGWKNIAIQEQTGKKVRIKLKRNAGTLDEDYESLDPDIDPDVDKFKETEEFFQSDD